MSRKLIFTAEIAGALLLTFILGARYEQTHPHKNLSPVWWILVDGLFVILFVYSAWRTARKG